MDTGLRTLILIVTLVVGVLAGGHAGAAVCAGAYASGTETLIRYDATTDICTIADSATMPGIDNTFGLLLNPVANPDRYSGIKYTTGGGFDPADGTIVSGILGTPSSTSNTVFQNLNGAFLAIVLAELYGQTYRMIATLVADGGQAISIRDAVVSPVPLPAALPLFAAAIGGMGLAGWRSRRRRQVATV